MSQTPNPANPLLAFDRLPDFSTINASHIQPAVEQVLSENYATLRALEDDQEVLAAPVWESVMGVLDDLEDRLSKVWSTVSHLNGVCNTPEIRAAYNESQPKITEYYSSLGQNEKLYRLIETLQSRADELQLDGSQRKILQDNLLSFRLAGVSLTGERKKRFTEIQKRLSELGNTFGNNVLDATMAWHKHIEEADLLSGIPDSTVSVAAETATQKGKTGYLLTLDFPCYYAVMTYADNAALREEMYKAYATRASEFGDKKLDNHDNIREILKLREEMADLLDYPNYAALSVARKMAKSVDRVNEFLDDLIRYSRPAAEQEYQELKDFARQQYQVSELNAWDVSYYSEKLRKQSFDISQEELRPWFPVDKVCAGLFRIVETLYGVTVEQDHSAPVWHPSVRFFNIRRESELIARFYFDLFTREGKRGGAWMADCRSRRLISEQGAAVTRQIPVAYLVCNFAPPSGSEPALLTHNDVTTLFHEFGHGLHHMLTRENYLGSSGINGVEWDAVELPSQLMENWCWDPVSIQWISGHYKTGEALPKTMLDRMIAAKNFQSGMKSVRQLEFALFDFALHQQPCDDARDFVAEILQQTRTKTAVYPVPDYNRFQNSFSHIFAGGYAAGYYSYKWAEVLSADVFSRFEQSGVLDPDTGKAFLDKILSRGGGANALELFKGFMGREPDLTALLIQDGLRKA
ncbi:M3 family metallopeptidase [Pseudohongiella spirulinae]|uniref:oligopeptidase A n=1 Tax=Pseudohongiella spirulinae TaxID=1249552 RepID=A0A0S2K9D4_9GAMM|nr:M3 family metallopeptidase [Pseudohongiella spirulinae]ALO44718.1 Oligopeptidase A [Pseudohongiella spirulinae]